jgi:hypothetical protein
MPRSPAVAETARGITMSLICAALLHLAGPRSVRFSGYVGISGT